MRPHRNRNRSSATPTETAEVAGPQVNVLAFGDSLFAGYGLVDPGTQSYPAKLEAALRAQGRNVRIANAGVSGDTTAAGRQRLAFTLDSQPVQPDLVILELGGNDLLRGLPPEQTRANLAAMLDELQVAWHPGRALRPSGAAQLRCGLAGEVRRELSRAGQAVRRAAGAVRDGKVFTDPDMLQADRIHPTAQGVDVLVAATAGRRGALPDRSHRRFEGPMNGAPARSPASSSPPATMARRR